MLSILLLLDYLVVRFSGSSK